MAEPARFHVVERDLADALEPQRHPVVPELWRPPARNAHEPAEGAAFEAIAVLPRMALERCGQWRQLVQQLPPARPRERRRHAHVVQTSMLIEQAEQERRELRRI